MDNNMTAIVSVIMIGLGFLNGMIVTTLLDKHEIIELHARVEKAEEENKRLQKKIKNLEEDLEDEQEDKEDLLNQLKGLLSKHMNLPPPTGPLQRSQACSDEMEEGEHFPTSPDVYPNPTSKE